MTDDPRCCGSGTCIIDASGRRWCGQQWDGLRVCHPPLKPAAHSQGSAPVAGSTPPELAA